jgi:hypothetical protein
VLLGHWPLSGVGATDRYIVHGNLFIDNPTEALLQAEGNVTLYNNVFVNWLGDGVAIREHHDIPRRIDVFQNTIVARGIALLLRNADRSFAQNIFANVVLGAHEGIERWQSDNVLGEYGDARSLLRNVDADLTEIDLSPRPDALRTFRAREPPARPLRANDVDFDGVQRTQALAGAYGGERAARSERFRRLAETLVAPDWR